MNMKKICMMLLAIAFAAAALAENYPYRADGLWITRPNHDNWLYETGEEATVDVEFYLYGEPVREATISYTLGDDMLPDDTSGIVTLTDGKVTIPMGTMTRPGFRDMRLTLEKDGRKFTHHIKLGFSPEKLKPYVGCPDDFDEFWARAIDEDRKFPLKYSVEEAPRYTTERMTCSLVKLDLPGGHAMYGYLFIPKGEGTFPAVFCPPGAGVKTIKEPLLHRYYGEGGMIRAEVEIHGAHPELSEEEFAELRNEFGDYLSQGLESPDDYYMKRVYLGCRRWLDLLTSLPEWDGRNLFTQGGSQGGALAITTAALDPRVTACCANHPALSDMTGYLGDKAGGYPHHFRKNPSEATPEAIRTLEYYDVVNFASRLRCPTRMTWGFNDNTCPPTTSYEVWNVITAPKTALITPINEHWTSADTERGHYEWLKSMVK